MLWIVVGLAVVAYGITLWGGFVYDDLGVIVYNAKAHTPSTWGQLWTKGYWELTPDHLYRPLVLQSFALQWWMAAGVAWPFHLVNILLHALVAAGVAKLGNRLAGARAGWIAGLIFAIHPVHVEVAANIVGRAELFCTGGFVVGLLLLLDRPLTVFRGVFISMCMLIALLSKEQGLLMPFVLILAWHFQTERHPQDAHEKRSLRITFVGVAYLFCAYVFFREIYLNLKMTIEPSQLAWERNPVAHAIGLSRALLPITVLGHYLELLIFPWRMSIDYGGAVVGDRIRFSDPSFILGCVGLLAGIAGLVWFWRKRLQAELFCLLSMGLFYSVISNSVFVIGTTVAERLLYLPSVFWCLLLGMGLARLPRRVAMSVVIAGVLLGSAGTILHAYQWNDSERVLRYSLKFQPRSSNVREGLVRRLLEKGDLRQAEEIISEGRRLIPQDPVMWLLSADVALGLNQPDRADGYVDMAFKLDKSPLISDYRNRIASWRTNSRGATRPAR